MKPLKKLLLLAVLPILAFAVAPQFSDDFSTDTTGNYATDGSGSFVYDSVNGRACANNTGSSELKFSQGLSPVSDTGTFTINVSAIDRTGTEGEIEVRLYDSAGNYYKIVNREGGSRTGGLTKYVNGTRVEAAWFSHKYQQGKNYQIKVSYAPDSTRVEAFGETVVISHNTQAIDVDSFTIRTKAQDACYDNILWTTTSTPPGNTPPVADAGNDRNVLTGSSVTLDGSGSLDADGDGMSYLWVFTSKPAGSTATLNTANPKYPTFTADKDGNYEITLTVNDGTVDSAPDTVRVSSVDDIAFSDDFSTDTTGNYTQSGSGTFSYDSANQRACVTPTGTGKSFSHALSPSADTGTFVIDVSTLQRTGSEGEIELILYENANTYYKIINRAGGSRTGGLSKYVNGTRVGAVWFHQQYAQGKDYRITVSYAPGAVKVEAFGETLKINNAASIDVGSFRVRTKAQKACYDNIAHTTESSPANTPPVAEAGNNQSVVLGSLVSLDGGNSNDADGDNLSYLWAFTSKPAGSTAALSSPTAKKPTFTADKNGDYIISLTVNDGAADSAPDTVKVTTVGNVAFFDDFSTDTTGNYSQSGSGTFMYDSANQRACVTPTGTGLSFSHDLTPAADTGTFSIDVSTLQRTGSEGEIEVRLYDSAGNYYKIVNRQGGTRTGGISKYVSGLRVDKAWFAQQYVQNSDYKIKVSYSPASTKVEAFGETLVMSSDHSPIEVSSFTVRTKAQKTCYDNIIYTAETSTTVVCPEKVFDRTVGGSDYDILESVAKDSDGNFYAVGHTASSDGDISGSNGNTDALLVKFDSNGNRKWVKTFGGSGNDVFESVTIDAAGNLYVAGFTDSNDGDISENYGTWDALLVKFDSNGNKKWVKIFGGSKSDVFTSVTIDVAGNLYAVGATYSSDGEITDGNNGNSDALLVKFDNDGTKKWDKTIGGSSWDSFASITVDTSGNLYAAGATPSNDGDISGNHGYGGYKDALLVKFDSNGNKKWVKVFGGSDNDFFTSVTIDSAGNLYAGGRTSSSDGDITDGNNGQEDALLAKFDSNGNMFWVKTFGGSYDDVFNSIVLDVAGNLYAVGSTESSDGDITDGNNGPTDALLVKFDSSGNILCDRTIGGSGGDHFNSVTVDTYGNLYTAGDTSSNDGDITNGYHGYWDGLLVTFSGHPPH